MARYLIAYDGSSQTTDYAAVIETLEKLGAKHIQLSVWGLRSEDTAEAIFSKIWPLLDDVEESLLVIQAGQGMERNSIELWADV